MYYGMAVAKSARVQNEPETSRNDGTCLGDAMPPLFSCDDRLLKHQI